MEQHKETVLVTGGSGFLGSYCILQLLREGYQVKTTIRSINKQPEGIRHLQTGGATHLERLQFIEADLTDDRNWHEAVKGCTYVLHVASPFPGNTPKDENELIIPAREGTIKVLQAARQAGVKRVVMTSSFAAVGYSSNPKEHLFTETDWTDPNTSLPAYIKSKAIAEIAAWDFIRTAGEELQLTVINPVGIFGPVLGENFSSSIKIIERIMSSKMPAIPNIYTNITDVRDVADLHLRAMIAPQAAGQRFLALSGGSMSFTEIAQTIRNNIPAIADRISTKTAPDWLLKLMSLFKKELKQVVPLLGVVKEVSNEKAIRLLGWQPRSNQECILATAQSLLDQGIVKV
ncbi:dihydroflavonol-4-reductase [Chitinophaga sp. YR627]|uniref:SDR family oxidoreductase n=1 Tax=Chitinophaga sp. YR627 TaxID=1881041 RepID=UPI0008E8900F|nr:aldehyde reductase [Chitinophaga sp. YR627]SFM74461.1 dihydroflavonol-4-reductase [Chitinophaga sp. YR627]